MSDAEIQPKYVGYPRTVYGTADRLQALGHALSAHPWSPYLFAACLCWLTGTTLGHLNPIKLGLIAFWAAMFGYFNYRRFRLIATGKGWRTDSAWIPVLIILVLPQLFAFYLRSGLWAAIGFAAPIVAISLISGYMVRAEIKRYGVRSRKSADILEAVLARRLEEVHAPPPPLSLYSGDAPSTGHK